MDRSTTRYPHGDHRVVTLPEGTVPHLEILHDRSITEIYVGDGDLAFTLRSYLDPENVATTLFVGDAGVADTTQSSRRFAVRYQTFD